MDRETDQGVTRREEDSPVDRPTASGEGPSRRRFLKSAAGTLAAVAAGGGAVCYVLRRAQSLPSAEVFPAIVHPLMVKLPYEQIPPPAPPRPPRPPTYVPVPPPPAEPQ